MEITIMPYPATAMAGIAIQAIAPQWIITKIILTKLDSIVFTNTLEETILTR